MNDVFVAFFNALTSILEEFSMIKKFKISNKVTRSTNACYTKEPELLKDKVLYLKELYKQSNLDFDLEI